MAKAKQLPSGNWRVRPSFTDEDGVFHTTSITEKTEKLANAKAIAWQAGIIKECREKSEITLDKAISSYIDSLEVNRASPTTIKEYDCRRRNSYPLIINKRISKISLTDIQSQVDARAKVVKPKTIKNDLTLLSAVLSLHRPDLNLKKIRRPEIDDEEMVIPDDDEARLLMNRAKADSDLYCAVLIATVTGMRRSEICALEWSDIDQKACTINVDKALVRNVDNDWVIKGPKKKSSKRVVQTEPEVISELMKHRTGIKKVVNITPDQVTERFIKMRDNLNMGEIRFHSLRHYKASVLLCLGVPLQVARKTLGHKTDHMIKRVYGHLVSGAKNEINKLAASHTTALLSGEKITYLPQKLPRAGEN